ncbi:kinase-like domain-containing protein [Pilobolus umbonatus]|nr:kinase-like domain-containing protein [Pilobolus umbonatus]
MGDHAQRRILEELASIKATRDYAIVEKLGHGSHGQVVLGVHRETNEKVAIKIVNRKVLPKYEKWRLGREDFRLIMQKEEDIRRRTVREAHLMLLLRHPHIVQLKTLSSTENYFYLSMNYVEGGQLLHYILDKGRLSENRARKFFRQIVSGLDFMHRHSIVHRDLKIENILIDKEGECIKIADFGLSNLFFPEKQLETYCGSVFFVAPELIRGEPYTGPEVDVWSLGVVLYTMLMGVVPFDHPSVAMVMKKIQKGKVDFIFPVSQECRDLIKRILNPDPEDRICLADVIRHSWVNMGYDHYINNYMVPRIPVSPPIDPQSVTYMVRGFGFPSAEKINAMLEIITASVLYRSSAQHIAQVDAIRQQQQNKIVDHSILIPPSDSRIESLVGNYDDPQTLPAGYHPLISLHTLTTHKALNTPFERKPDEPVEVIVPITVGTVNRQRVFEIDNYYPRNLHIDTSGYFESNSGTVHNDMTGTSSSADRLPSFLQPFKNNYILPTPDIVTGRYNFGPSIDTDRRIQPEDLLEPPEMPPELMLPETHLVESVESTELYDPAIYENRPPRRTGATKKKKKSMISFFKKAKFSITSYFSKH